MTRTAFTFAAIVASSLLFSVFEGRASAYCRTTTIPISPDFQPTATRCWEEGLPLFWKNACVGYTISEKASAQVSYQEARDTIDAAFTKWSNATCPSTTGDTRASISMKDLGPASCERIEYNQNNPNQNLIFFRDDEWPHSDANNTLALTTVTFDTQTGEIYDADMEINTHDQTVTVSDPIPREGYDFASIVTHESGHFLGLAHSGDLNATMYARYKPGSTQMRALTSDDIAGICAVYPADGTRETAAGTIASEMCDPTPRHGFSADCSDSPDTDNTQPSSSGGGCSIGGNGSTTSFAWVSLFALFAVTGTRRRHRGTK